MKEIELIDKRKLREKHFLQEDGTIRAEMYDCDIHFKKNERFEEIDNTLIESDDFYSNKSNSFKVKFNKNSQEALINIEKDEYYLKMNFLGAKKSACNLNKENFPNKLVQEVRYKNIFENVDLEYKLISNKLKESIILKNKSAIIEEIKFSINTNLDLILEEKGFISALNHGKEVLRIEKPYMIDLNNKYNEEIYYEIVKDKNNYVLSLHLDLKWLKDKGRVYPVIIDPTITDYTNENNVYDTYIYPGDTNVDRNSQDILKCGVERINNADRVNRTLIKFNLPLIGTGSQVVDAKLNLVGYPILNGSYDFDIVNVHRVTTDWSENTANWNAMNDKFDTRVEGAFESYRSSIDSTGNITPNINEVDLTDLVKKWYTNIPNYGIMLKQNTELFKNTILPSYFSKNNNVTGSNPKPILSISYRNQNGIEDYMDYQTQKFNQGASYVNKYNGNLVTSFNVGKTYGSHLPVLLSITYNTNDVILGNNIGYGLGWRLNYHQTIKTWISIDGVNYLEYTDGNGTIHYFENQRKTLDSNGSIITNNYENTYFDEEGMDLKIIDSENYYTLIDNKSNSSKFMKINGIGYLSEIEDTLGNKIEIYYNNGCISKIKDSSNAEINLTYLTNSILVVSPSYTTEINYENSKLTSIENEYGIVQINYNSHNIISTITDFSGIKILYEYYEQSPYRVMKVSEYGINNGLGKWMEFHYEYNSTTLIDNNGKINTLTFNSHGVTKSISNLKDAENINNAYGFVKKSIEGINGLNINNNKTISCQIPIKYVKNYITNSSFETAEIPFNASQNMAMTICDDCYVSGIHSLKCVSSSVNQYISKDMNVLKGKNYTFSCYIKNTGTVKLSLSYLSENSERIESVYQIEESNNNFERYNITIDYPSTAVSNLNIKILSEAAATIYLDDVQLEEGEVANGYNLIDNSDFSNGLTGWNLSANDYITYDPVSTSGIFDVVTLSSGINALKINMNPAVSTEFSKDFILNGKEGESFNISFWYKNEGLPGGNAIGDLIYNYVILHFEYTDQTTGHCEFPSESFNPNESKWQFFSENFVAEKDFNSVTLCFAQQFNANSFYITNISLFKDIKSINYEYDNDGNLITKSNLKDQTITYEYDSNNKLIQMMNPTGNKFKIEYNNDKTSQIISNISNTGVTESITYDENNNPILVKNSHKNLSGDITSGLYKIRLKGTNSYVNLKNNLLSIDNDKYIHDSWNIEAEGTYFKIRHSIINNKYFTCSNNLIVLSNYDSDSSLFSLILNKNGSYSIKSKLNNKCIKFNGVNLVLDEYIENDYSFEFYIELQNCKFFIENSALYSNSGKYLLSIKNTLLNDITYNVNENTGLLQSMTNSNGSLFQYTYNNKNQLASCTCKDRTLNYTYNSAGKITNISEDSRNYNIIYDEFLNVKNVKVENVSLINNNYGSNNGNLTSSTYGNGNQIVYEYDDFDRVVKVTKNDDIYKFIYGGNGDLLKVMSNYGKCEYVYNMSKKLNKYIYNDFEIKYIYDTDDNIIDYIVKLQNLNEDMHNTIDSFGRITGVTLNLDTYSYEYDDFDRISAFNINNILRTNYKYKSNGYRTSTLLYEIKNNNDVYSYKYNKFNNITAIYHNNKLENKYYYNEYNELLKEKNYLLNELTEYKYDNLGNLLSKKVFDINSYSLKSFDKFLYENSNWKDQLTKFNDISISYDLIGNPISIGNATLQWTNGRQLSKYIDSNNTIDYKYNYNGIRTWKKINNSETYYYLDGDDIVAEKKDNNIIYYIRNDISGLIGFKYNGNTYYYLKNAKNDIIGILDSLGNCIAKYIYDSWGNILSVLDNNGDEINDISNVAHINPFRYRSYYYDRETNLYYLNSRYYSPVIKRFINADNYLFTDNEIFSGNMYSYCNNNPVNYEDPSGHLFKGIISIIVTIALTVLLPIYIINTEIKKAKAEKSIRKTQERKSELKDETDRFNSFLKTNANKVKEDTKYLLPSEKLIYIYYNYNNQSEYNIKNSEHAIIYDNWVYSAEDLGNFHFGYTTRAMGIPTPVLVFGAGMYQLLTHGSDTFTNCISASHCDDMRDTYYIIQGAMKYDSEN